MKAHIALAALLMAGCPRPEEVVTPYKELDQVPELLPADIYVGRLADANMSPILVWVFGPTSAPEQVLVVGHADGPCCHEVSKALMEAASSVPDTWIGYGITLSRDPGPHRSDLATLASRVRALESAPVCQGQLFVSLGQRTAPWQAMTAQVEADALAAMEAAREMNRPILVPFDVEESSPPLLLPLAGPDGLPVRLPVSTRSLAIPQNVKAAFSLDGLGPYASNIRMQLKAIEAILQAKKELARFKDEKWAYTIQTRSVQMNYRDADVEREVLEGTAVLRDIERRCTATIPIWTALERLEVLDERAVLEQRQHAQDLVSGLRTALQDNERALSAIQGLEAAPGPRTIKATFHVPMLEGGGHPEFLDEIRELDEATLKSESAALRKELAEVEKLARASKASGPAPLVDAFLRGWPATFGTTDNEDAYDAWLRARHEEVWRQVGADLKSRGLTLSAGADVAMPAGALQRGNVLFRVSATSTGFEAVPYFLMHAHGVMVADPTTGLIRYESPRTAPYLMEPERASKALSAILLLDQIMSSGGER